MSLEFPSKASIRSAILSIWQSERPDADSTIYGDLWLFSRVASVLTFRMHQTIQRGINAIFPTSSFGVYLDNWLSWIGAPDGQGGFGRILAGESSATACLTVTAVGGNIAAGALQNEELTDTAGKTYKITDANALITVGNTESMDVEAVDTGTDTNLESGTVLTFVSPPANTQSTATLTKDLDGGTDEETDSEGRARLVYRLRNPAMSGNVADYVTTIEDVSPGNLKAYVWPWRNEVVTGTPGYGQTDFIAFQLNESGSDRYILAADDLYTDITDAVDSAMPPIGAVTGGAARQLTVSNVSTDLDITLTMNPGIGESDQVDWDAQANKTTVSAHDAGGPNITASANVCAPTITNGLEVGHRVVIGGIEGTVTKVNDGSAAQFEVTTWPWATGAAALNGLNICAGGGLVGQIKQGTVEGSGIYRAEQAYMDTIGPAAGTYAAQDSVQDWDDTARITGIQSAGIVEGDGKVIDVTVDDLGGGVVDLAPSYGTGATVQAIGLDELTIWQTWVS
jgi:hypothetical protein